MNKDHYEGYNEIYIQTAMDPWTTGFAYSIQMLSTGTHYRMLKQ